MAGKFGSDFSAGQPSDDDLVKYGARWIRDIKQRIKDTFGVIFDLESGQLQDHSIDPIKLKDAYPAAEGTWNTVTVDPNGLVVSGENVDTVVSANINRFVYFFGGGSDNLGNAIAQVLGIDDDALTVAQYSFTVPVGVTRIFIRLQASGGGASAGAGGGGGGYAETIVTVAPGDVWLIWIGQGGQGALAGTPTKGSMTKFQFNPSKRLTAAGGQQAVTTTPGGSFFPTNAGLNGVLSRIGGPGTTALGGLPGDGGPAPNNYGNGGGPAGGGQSGNNGYVIVEYWQ